MSRRSGFVVAGACALPFVMAMSIAVTAAGADDTSTGDPMVCRATASDGQPIDIAALGFMQEQIDNAITIYTVGAERGLPQRAMIIAIATAMQESTLHNYGDLGDNNDHDSLGLFQQRPSQGWGTADQILDPEYAAGKFYDKLIKIPGWQQMPVTVAAQSVQNSAYPDAYADDEHAATLIVETLSTMIKCAAAPVSADGFTHPVPGSPIGSGYRSADRPDHDGLDFTADKATLIHAAGSGIVITALCNASTSDGTPYSCDTDGGTDIMGCGWYVEILHPDNTVTRYCHMIQRPNVTVGDTVTAGKIIGLVGSSGNSSGPHLHFEAHTGSPATSKNATNPSAYLTERGVDVR